MYNQYIHHHAYKTALDVHSRWTDYSSSLSRMGNEDNMPQGDPNNMPQGDPNNVSSWVTRLLNHSSHSLAARRSIPPSIFNHMLEIVNNIFIA